LKNQKTLNKAFLSSFFINPKLTDPQAKLISLIENIQRENLTPMKEARAYAINLGINFKTFTSLQMFFNKLKQNGKIPKFALQIGKDRGQ